MKKDIITRALTAMQEEDMLPSMKQTYIFICSSAMGNDGLFDKSKKHIQDLTGMTQPTVDSHMKTLYEKKYIYKTPDGIIPLKYLEEIFEKDTVKQIRTLIKAEQMRIVNTLTGEVK